MSADAQRTLALADKILVKAEAVLYPLDQEIAGWPADFSAIMWETVADIASRRALACRERERQK
jgi:hypothetical protein